MAERDPRTDLANILKELNDTLDASRAARRSETDRRSDISVDYTLAENDRRFWRRRIIRDRRIKEDRRIGY